MLIKFTRNGSIFEIDYQGETFTKGDNNVHVVETILLFDEITPNDVGYVQFLREGEQESSPLFPMVAVDVVNPDDGTIHNGFKFKMGSSWYTDIAGTLKMTLLIKRVSENGVETTKAHGVMDIAVGDSASQEVPSTITKEEYDSLMALIVSKLAITDYKLIDFTTSPAMPIATFVQNILQHSGTIDGSKNTFLYTTYLTYQPYGETSEVQTKVFAVYNSPYLTIITANGDAFRINTTQGNQMAGLNIGRMNINSMYVVQELNASNAVVRVNTPIQSNHATSKKYVDDIKTELQDKINGIEAAQNLLDIVSDYQALDEYEIDYLQINDKIKVLQDENHDNAGTYYKWNGNVWVFIGKDGIYYTQTEVDTIKNNLQAQIDSLKTLINTLISNNVSYKED